jgi:hypothetical protein
MCVGVYVGVYVGVTVGVYVGVTVGVYACRMDVMLRSDMHS